MVVFFQTVAGFEKAACWMGCGLVEQDATTITAYVIGSFKKTLNGIYKQGLLNCFVYL